MNFNQKVLDEIAKKPYPPPAVTSIHGLVRALRDGVCAGGLLPLRMSYPKDFMAAGFPQNPPYLRVLTLNNSKVQKGILHSGIISASFDMSPCDMGGIEVCEYSLVSGCGCRGLLCLNFAGNGLYMGVQHARMRRKMELFSDPPRWLASLRCDVHDLKHFADGFGMKLMIRLNTFSDVPWERAPAMWDLLASFRDVFFYDYTKGSVRLLGDCPPNYRLIYSYQGIDGDTERCEEILQGGGNVAMVLPVGGNKTTFDVSSNALPRLWRVYEIVDGDRSDERWLDPPGTVVGLRSKGFINGRKLPQYVCQTDLVW